MGDPTVDIIVTIVDHHNNKLTEQPHTYRPPRQSGQLIDTFKNKYGVGDLLEADGLHELPSGEEVHAGTYIYRVTRVTREVQAAGPSDPSLVAVPGLDTISPSLSSKLHLKEVRLNVLKFLPNTRQNLGDMEKQVALFSCRPVDAPVSLFQHVLLLSPEFGFMRDAANGALQGVPPGHYVQAWVALLETAAQFFDDEQDRQLAMMDWLDHWFPGVKALIPVANSSSSNSSKRHRGNDGQATVSWVPAAQNAQTHTTHTLYPTLYTEYKFELASPGDPQLQLARYQLAQYGNDAERWQGRDLLLIATGVPALGMDVAGANLLFHGMCILRTNVAGMEPLSTRLPLLDCGSRWPQQAHQGAMLLAAFDLATHNLKQRYKLAVLPGLQATETADELKHQQRAAEVLQALTHPVVDYSEAFRSVQLDHHAIGALANRRMEQLLKCPLPYPLWGHHRNLLNYQNVRQLCLAAMPGKAVFEAEHPTNGHKLFIKFTAMDYPEWIHKALARQGWTPGLVECRVLPGGGCMVVMEMLGEGWQNAEVWLRANPRSDQQPHVRAMLMHLLGNIHRTALPAPNEPVLSPSSTWSASRQRTWVGGKVVLGDARTANGMVKVEEDPLTHQPKVTAARFVDLDWAGVEGVARYPPLSIWPNNGIKWHADVKPGGAMTQEHDVFLLENSWPSPVGAPSDMV